jgi:hypothetical protein
MSQYMGQWKYQSNVKKSVEYVRFQEGVSKKMLVNEWDFPKGSPYLFRCYVAEEDGVEVDKLWTVWDYATMKALKKRLGVKSSSPKEISVTMRMDDDDEPTFEVS